MGDVYGGKDAAQTVLITGYKSLWQGYLACLLCFYNEPVPFESTSVLWSSDHRGAYAGTFCFMCSCQSEERAGKGHQPAARCPNGGVYTLCCCAFNHIPLWRRHTAVTGSTHKDGRGDTPAGTESHSCWILIVLLACCNLPSHKQSPAVLLPRPRVLRWPQTLWRPRASYRFPAKMLISLFCLQDFQIAAEYITSPSKHRKQTSAFSCLDQSTLNSTHTHAHAHSMRCAGNNVPIWISNRLEQLLNCLLAKVFLSV